MAVLATSDQINRHLEAALALSKRDILARLLHQAELCLELHDARTAVIVAGVALEELHLFGYQDLDRRHRPNLDMWRKLRDRATQVSPAERHLDEQSVREMLAGLHELLAKLDPPQIENGSFRHSENLLSNIRGKYANVPTSVEGFLNRKRDDLDLEHPG